MKLNITIVTAGGKDISAWVDKDEDEIQSAEPIVPASAKVEIPGETFYVTRLQDLLQEYKTLSIKLISIEDYK